MVGGRTAWRAATIVSWLVVWGVVMVGATHAQMADDAAALHEADRLYQAGKYPEVTEIERAGGRSPRRGAVA